MTGGARRHIVLVGLPGSGKSTVGRLAAAKLKAPFVDLDEAIAASSGKRIAEVFAERGEPAFRELERQAMERALAASPSVIAAGGGWAAQPGNLEAAADHAVTVYLRVAPEAAAARVAVSEATGATSGSRPLLAGREGESRMRELFRARRSFYQRCRATVSADQGPPEEVAEAVAKLARSLAGWY
jgi:shikimate kinase